MKEFKDFSVEDFVQHPSFRRWVLKSSEADMLFWQQWYLSHPDKKALVDEAYSLVQGLQIVDDTHYDEVELAVEQIVRLRNRTGKAIGLYSLYKYTAIVLVCLGIGTTWYLFNRVPAQTAFLLGSKEVEWFKNNTAKSKTIELSDSSFVHLLPNSQLAIAKDYNSNKREVWLKGSAFFEVKTNKNKPFVVQSNHVLTKVYGTSFWIKESASTDSISVAVVSGKVSVQKVDAQTSQSSNEIFLQPRQHIVMVKEGENQLKSFDNTIDNSFSDSTVATHSTQNFQNTLLSDVLAILSLTYNKKIIYDDARFASCRLTARFTDEHFYEKLDLICLTVQAEYEEFEDHILLRGAGCP